MKACNCKPSPRVLLNHMSLLLRCRHYQSSRPSELERSSEVGKISVNLSGRVEKLDNISLDLCRGEISPNFSGRTDSDRLSKDNKSWTCCPACSSVCSAFSFFFLKTFSSHYIGFFSGCISESCLLLLSHVVTCCFIIIIFKQAFGKIEDFFLSSHPALHVYSPRVQHPLQTLQQCILCVHLQERPSYHWLSPKLFKYKSCLVILL